MSKKNIAELFGDLRELTIDEMETFEDRISARFKNEVAVENYDYNIRYGHDEHSAHIISVDFTHGYVFIDNLKKAQETSISLQRTYSKCGGKIIKEYVFHEENEVGFMWQTPRKEANQPAGALCV